MSNVLIGIIGVILFIGLALAGALFLGPRFQEANNNSKASATVQGLKQVSDGLAMYQTQEGKKIPNDGTGADMVKVLVNTKYLKAVPYAPSAIAYNVTAGTPYEIINPGGTGGYVQITLAQNSSADPICKAIQKQLNGLSTVDAGTDHQAGCAFDDPYYYAYFKI